MVVEEQRPVVPPAGSWRERPIRRVLVVGTAAALVSAVWHLVVAKTISTLGEAMFPGPFGGYGYIEVSVPVGLLVIWLVLALLRVGETPVVWVIGSPLAVGGLVLALAGVNILNVGGWADRLHAPGWVPYVSADSIGIAVAYMLAAIITDVRLPGRVRALVPVTVVAVVVAVCAVVYVIRY